MTEQLAYRTLMLRNLSGLVHIIWVFSMPCVSQSLAQLPAPADAALVSVAPSQAAVEVTSASHSVPTATTPALKRWPKLSERQKQALSPLRDQWDTLTEQQRTKWLNISDTFLQLSDEEQITMHGRMSEWARMSPKDRNAARFNFNSTRSLSVDDKRAQWEAYQSLPAHDKQQLSSGPKPPIKSASRTTLPASSRLVSPPALPVNTPKGIPLVAPSQPIDPKTLLPKLGSQ
ncbi:MAG: hypothetical protein CFE38_07565 [Comamonadaceae bacterium PBBC1]|nr:MAG: hypothetical protein CFE38_07565 [Comamonadaceae bacterium PBBC1]